MFAQYSLARFALSVYGCEVWLNQPPSFIVSAVAIIKFCRESLYIYENKKLT
jgi:hypothetical protein